MVCQPEVAPYPAYVLAVAPMQVVCVVAGLSVLTAEAMTTEGRCSLRSAPRWMEASPTLFSAFLTTARRAVLRLAEDTTSPSSHGAMVSVGEAVP
jgi:hypothetical protein